MIPVAKKIPTYGWQNGKVVFLLTYHSESYLPNGVRRFDSLERVNKRNDDARLSDYTFLMKRINQESIL
jgi:hypothetical protein